jgi:endo-1,4-beta-xylanase
MTYYDAKTNSVSFNAPHFSSFALSSYTKTFDDIKGHWAKANIEEMASKQITTGITETQFAPNRSITRAEFTVMALKAIDQFKAGSGTFNDVRSNSWYFDYLAKAKDLGLIAANSKGNFYPDQNISREDMAVIIAKAHAIMKDSTLDVQPSTVKFSDASDIDASKLKYVSYVQEKGIINGYNYAFMPDDEASRAEALSIIRQMIRN